MKVGVRSDVDPLRRVILHRPGREVSRLTPSNMQELLFDDVLWVNQAQREHDEFAAKLTDEGVEVTYFDQLLTQTLAEDAARTFVIERTLREEILGQTATRIMREYAAGLDAAQLCDLVTAGITRAELEDQCGAVRSTLLFQLQDSDFVVPCLPNLYFTRDASSWINGGVCVNAMQMRARRRESTLYRAIYQWHPDFRDTDFALWSNEPASRHATIEGGDIIVPGGGAVFVGLSERTTPAGFERLAGVLLDGDETMRTVVGVHLDASREFMHLDTVMSMVDEETFVLYPELGDRQTITATRGGDGQMQVRAHEPERMREVLADAMGRDSVRFLSAPTGQSIAQWGLWNCAFNLLALAPRVVVAYDRNERMNEFLSDQGVRVITIPSTELARGHGGPRCMSCPVYRA